MLLFIVLSNLLCLLPTFAFADATTPEDPVNLAAHHAKRLSNPLRKLLHKRDAILSAGGINARDALALNSTSDHVAETIAFENSIDIPGEGHAVYFVVCQTARMIEIALELTLILLVKVKGEVDRYYSATVEFWYDYRWDRQIGVYHGYLIQGVDMKIADSANIMQGEARLYTVKSGEWILLVFEAYGSVHLPSAPIQKFAPFAKAIKRWKFGNLMTIQDVPSTSGIQTVSNVTIMDTSVSAE